MFRQSRLEEQGFIFYRIWSTNWWNSAEKELKKLVLFILQYDKDEKAQEYPAIHEVLQIDEIIPVTFRPEMKMRVTQSSIVTVKNPEGKVLKVKFGKTQSIQPIKADRNGLITVYEKSPLAVSVIGRTEGEICPLGMLEAYYEILKVE